jgi:CRISPR-associated protein Csm4
MLMETLSLRITPRSAFGTPPRGDTLFGQLCWSVRRRYGSARLAELLVGYTDGRPFAVVSDAMPAGYVPRPMLPLSWLGDIKAEERKVVKKRTWLPMEAVSDPAGWLKDACTLELSRERAQPHNSISRVTGTTGRGDFAPYQTAQLWYYDKGSALDCRIVHDPARIDAAAIVELFADMGAFGFGRDATIGLGRFDVSRNGDGMPAYRADGTSYLTLAPSVPQGAEWDAERCFYQPFTRFGRHGAEVAVETGKPFKTPILMATTGAVLTPLKFSSQSFVGRGIGGDGTLSKSIPETVHQGYAPVVCIRVVAARKTS